MKNKLRDLMVREPMLVAWANRLSESIQFTLNGKPEPSDRGSSLAQSLFNRHVLLIRCRYSLGYSLSELRGDLEESIQLFEGCSIDNEDFFSSYSGYDSLLSLISIAVLLDMDEQIFIRILKHWQRYKIEDKLIEYLISFKIPNNEISSAVLLPKTFELLISAIEDESEKGVLVKLQQYLNEWYKNSRSCSWNNTHTTNQYSGYWCFEAAAIAKIKGIDLSDTKFGEYFPYSFFNLPEQFKESKPRVPKGMQRISYPKFPAYTIDVPDSYRDLSEERLGVISEDSKFEIASTVYRAGRKSLEGFNADRQDAVTKNMPWYVPIDEGKPVKVGRFKGFVHIYDGIWDGEKESTRYQVYTFGAKGFFIGLTFTYLAAYENDFNEIVSDILKSVKLKL